MTVQGLLAVTALFFGTIAAGRTPAQRTWIVDQRNGAGSHFQTIQAAIDAAQPHDAVVVRPGTYATATTRKGLRVTGEPGALLDTSWRPFRVERLPANETCVLHGFETDGSYPMRIEVFDNRGTVILQHLRIGTQLRVDLDNMVGIDIRDSDLVSLHGCATYGLPGLRVERSTVAMSGCDFSGQYIWRGWFAPAVVLRNCVATISQPRFLGATDYQSFGATPAMTATDSDVTIAGTAECFLQGGPTSPGTARPAIDQAGGTIVVDPRIGLNPFVPTQNPIAGFGTVVQRISSMALASPTRAGGVLTTALSAPPHAIALLAISVARRPRATPLGACWLDPQDFVVLWVGMVDQTGWQHASFSVPADAPPGASGLVQGIVDTGSGPRMTTPIVVTVLP